MRRNDVRVIYFIYIGNFVAIVKSKNIFIIGRFKYSTFWRFLRYNGQISCTDGYLHAVYDCAPFRFRPDKSDQLCDGDLLIFNK